MKRILCLLLLATIFCSLPVRAGTLQALVVEVHDGHSLTVENTGRRIRVVLKGAAAPDGDQPYAEVARQHLSDLVMGKQVSIEYTGIAAGTVFIARVICNGRDISLQMIRDGVAWFNANDSSDISEADQRVFAEAEQAARSERRGLWQDPAPVAPWEWGRARTAAAAQEQSSPSLQRPRAQTYHPAHAGEAGDDRWPVFTMNNGRFLIRMPRGGDAFEASIQIPNRAPFDLHFYGVRHLKIGYVVVWASGPGDGVSIDSLFERAREGLNNMEAAAQMPCEYTQERDTPLNGFTGRRYVIHDCIYHGAIRLYYKREGHMLRMYFAGAMSIEPNDPHIRDFLESFEIH